MSLYIVKAGTKSQKGDRYEYFVLRENYWDSEHKHVAVRFIGYVGKNKTLTESKARAICESKGLTIDQLRAVKGLKIVPDEQASPNGQRRRAKSRRVSSRGHGQE